MCVFLQPDLLSARRAFLRKVDVMEVSDVMLGRGENASLFVLSDQIEVCEHVCMQCKCEPHIILCIDFCSNKYP